MSQKKMYLQQRTLASLASLLLVQKSVAKMLGKCGIWFDNFPKNTLKAGRRPAGRRPATSEVWLAPPHHRAGTATSQEVTVRCPPDLWKLTSARNFLNNTTGAGRSPPIM